MPLSRRETRRTCTIVNSALELSDLQVWHKRILEESHFLWFSWAVESWGIGRSQKNKQPDTKAGLFSLLEAQRYLELFQIKSWISQIMDRCKRPGSAEAREMHPVSAARPDLDPSYRHSIISAILPRRSFIFNTNYQWLLPASASDYHYVCQTLAKILPLWTSLQCVWDQDELSSALDILFLYFSSHSKYVNWEERSWPKYLHLLYRLIALSAKSRLMVCRIRGWYLADSSELHIFLSPHPASTFPTMQ